MDNLSVFFDAEAEKLSDAWLAHFRDPIKRLPDDRQETYRQITALSREPRDIDLARPVSRLEATAIREKDGSDHKLSTYERHLLCDSTGKFPAELNEWEAAVLKAEARQAGFLFWYRNPQQPTQDSLGFAYQDGEETRIARPEFLFFAALPNGTVVADIVDPHGVHLADALPKLQGLARYAETHAQSFRRIEAVAAVDGRLRVLDMRSQQVREAVFKATTARGLYEGATARNYS